MRDKKDNATYELPGFAPESAPIELAAPEPKRATAGRSLRPRRIALKQEQLELLEPTDTTGLPVWRRDEGLDLTGLPIWAPA